MRRVKSFSIGNFEFKAYLIDVGIAWYWDLYFCAPGADGGLRIISNLLPSLAECDRRARRYVRDNLQGVQ